MKEILEHTEAGSAVVTDVFSERQKSLFLFLRAVAKAKRESDFGDCRGGQRPAVHSVSSLMPRCLRRGL